MVMFLFTEVEAINSLPGLLIILFFGAPPQQLKHLTVYVCQHFTVDNHTDELIFYKRYGSHFVAINVNLYRLGKIVRFK